MFYRILVIEGLVLFRIKNFKKRRGRVPSYIGTCFVNLIQQHNWIVHPNSLLTDMINLMSLYYQFFIFYYII